MSFQDEYTVRLSAFEGPLDLLLYLIRRAEVDIHDIPIVEITDQFLGAIEGLKDEDSLDIDAAGEFLVMAATLVELKSRTLAPRRAEGEDGEGSGGGSPVKKPVSHQDLLAMDYLYKTKTKNELNFLKRQIEKDVDSTEKKAKLNHKQNIEKYNKYLAAIPEQNELRRINWHKH